MPFSTADSYWRERKRDVFFWKGKKSRGNENRCTGAKVILCIPKWAIRRGTTSIGLLLTIVRRRIDAVRDGNSRRERTRFIAGDVIAVFLYQSLPWSRILYFHETTNVQSYFTLSNYRRAFAAALSYILSAFFSSAFLFPMHNLFVVYARYLRYLFSIYVCTSLFKCVRNF